MHALVTPGSPQIFAFHGTGGNETQFAEFVRVAWPEAGVVAPRGDVDENGANRFFRRTAEGVYDMEDLARRTTAMIAFARGHLRRDVPAYAFGYSNGANILAAMTFEAPDLFERVALLHPLVPWSVPPQPGLRDRRLLITGGRRDPICPAPVTEALVEYYQSQGAEVAVHLHEGGHELRPGEMAALKAAFKD